MNIDQHLIPFGSAEFQVGIADVAAQQIAVLIHHSRLVRQSQGRAQSGKEIADKKCQHEGDVLRPQGPQHVRLEGHVAQG